MNDEALHRLVVDELNYEPGIDAIDIGVAAEKDVVALSGHITDCMQKMAAERVVWRVKGVTTDIMPAMVVRADDLRRRTQQGLKRGAQIEAAAAYAGVRGNETVHIDRRVDNWSEMQAVQHAARSTPGFRHVDDPLTFS